MQKFTSVTSNVIPLRINDIDTDMIIPAQYLTSISREGYGENLFRRLKDDNKDFAINLPDYKDAKILLAGDNFGCGSSREHAVWAILGAGIRTVISSSFADIFASNSAKNGLVLVKVQESELKLLFDAVSDPKTEITVNLEKQSVSIPGGASIKFPFDQFRKHCILNGLDDLDYLLSRKNEIDQYKSRMQDKFFFDTLTINN